MKILKIHNYLNGQLTGSEYRNLSLQKYSLNYVDLTSIKKRKEVFQELCIFFEEGKSIYLKNIKIPLDELEKKSIDKLLEFLASKETIKMNMNIFSETKEDDHYIEITNIETIVY